MKPIGRRLGALTVGLTIFGMVVSTSPANANTPTQQDPRPDVTTPRSLPLTIGEDALRVAAGSGASLPLTLITGDKVHVGIGADAKPVVREIEAAPRPDGETVTFHTVTRKGSVYVVPNDALSLIEQGLLDWGLFDLAKLAAHVAEGTVGRVPVLITYHQNLPMRAAQKVAGARAGSTLASINAQSMDIHGDGRWWQEVRGKDDIGMAAARTAGALSGVKRVWLNELARINLDTSVAQINAPIVWDRGYDGSGVTVAVLDSGIDPNHPDVAGKIVEQVDFTGDASGPKDGHGHGTHVAATVAGSGAASDGLRKGVAPAAKLMVGKVCNDGGSCPTDAVIAGMEWAAHSDAKVVNMSLGSGATDGTDPLSEALNNLSRDTGTLFVVSAGNSGPGDSTVGAPGAADEALTVAAVNKEDAMADFSSRGPRLGDGAAKPDIAAPGVDIVAARAAGTAMGTVAGEHYTSASGTSMAAPHVAGAAAIIAEKYPELTGQEIKGHLMSTAVDLGHGVYAQGVGRVDLARAVDPTITTTGNLHFGRDTYPHSPVVRTLTYTNHTDQPITLNLSASVASNGQSPPAGLFSFDTDQVTVPAQGTTEVTATVDGRVLERGGQYGSYTGVLTARDADGVVQASNRISAFLEPERIELTIDVIPPTGATSVRYGNALIVPVDDKVHLHDDAVSVPGGNRMTARLFEGTFAAALSVTWQDARGEQHSALPMAAEVKLSRPTSVTLDLRKAKPVRAKTPKPTETYFAAQVIQRTSATGDWGMTAQQTASNYGAYDPNWWALPTDKVRTGTLTHSTYLVQTTPLITMKVTGVGSSFDLSARYSTPDSSVYRNDLQWTEGEQTLYQPLRLRVPRLPNSGTKTVVYGGTGLPDDLAKIDARGKLVLLTPTDICPATTCQVTSLRERVAAVAAAGGVGVLVAGPPGLQRLTFVEPVISCPDGPESCPAIEPYAALPILTVPADEANQLIARLEAKPKKASSVRIKLGGSPDPQVYTLAFHDSGRVPNKLPYQVRHNDLDRVDHRFHANRPGEVSSLTWGQWTETGPDPVSASLPLTSTQDMLTTFVTRQKNAINKFAFTWVDHTETPTPSSNQQEDQELLAGVAQTVYWNTGPTLPGAVPQVRTRSGFTLDTGTLCAGCRQADTFYPNMYLTTSTGSRQAMIGIVNNAGLAEGYFGINNCESSACDFRLSDESGNEFERRLAPVSAVIGSDAAGDPVSRTSGGQR
ncbi:hypothetical protein GCM10009541_40190 [Micromonospora gifhornensis]|uniref:Peptidase S8/S53 domain-containing protein n=1 Tax=Micromonospora gifhornensis TaxID=84594 RepID=A0ABQ4IE02_9ACTN|nr:hypothetical protein Vgi01_28190 [Micromonospora gifhornensis]